MSPITVLGLLAILVIESVAVIASQEWGKVRSKYGDFCSYGRRKDG